MAQQSDSFQISLSVAARVKRSPIVRTSQSVVADEAGDEHCVYWPRGQEFKRFGFVFLTEFADGARLGLAGKLFEYCCRLLPHQGNCHGYSSSLSVLTTRTLKLTRNLHASSVVAFDHRGLGDHSEVAEDRTITQHGAVT